MNIYVEHGNSHLTSHAMESLKKSMKWDEETYGLEYDLDLFQIVAVSHFNMGAMENKGLNIFNSKFILSDTNISTDTDYLNIESIIAHEYFHNWTGNRVTCRDWFQLTLKEGLTVFRDQQFTSDIRNPIVQANIPCVGLGCLGGNLSQNNKVDEWIDIEDFSLMVEVTSEIIERWCSGEQKKGRMVS